MAFSHPKSRPAIMGILNLTPDSFSDGGVFNTEKKALQQVEQMIKHGVDLIDIGAESSGPGSKNVNLEIEAKRLLPILKKIRKLTPLPLSIDTSKSQIADMALQEGANIINDITALRGDSKMAQVIAKHQAQVILMYSKDPTPRTTIKKKRYSNLINTIKTFLQKQVQYAKKNGIKKQNIILDPGMGHFISAIPKYSYQLISELQKLSTLKHPILIGLSRKSFLGGPLKERDQQSLPISAIAYFNGASIIRTHNVQSTTEFFKFLNQ